ncbi:MAG TPA: hypothetical protein VIN72_13910 [Lutibacter sp.]
MKNVLIFLVIATLLLTVSCKSTFNATKTLQNDENRKELYQNVISDPVKFTEFLEVAGSNEEAQMLLMKNHMKMMEDGKMMETMKKNPEIKEKVELKMQEMMEKNPEMKKMMMMKMMGKMQENPEMMKMMMENMQENPEMMNKMMEKMQKNPEMMKKMMEKIQENPEMMKKMKGMDKKDKNHSSHQ